MVLVCQHRQSVELDEPRISLTLQFLQTSSREVWGCLPAPGVFWGLHMSEVAQTCPAVCNPMNCSLPGSSIRGIFQAKILEWFGEQWKNYSKKNEEKEPNQKHHPVVDVTGDGSNIWCCKEQYHTRTWNVRSMNQGKLDVVRQELARVNTDILGICELKWTGMSEFNWDDHYIHYSG